MATCEDDNIPVDQFIRVDTEALRVLATLLTTPSWKKRKISWCSVNTGWSDIGSWSSLWDVAEKDGEGNAVWATP